MLEYLGPAAENWFGWMASAGSQATILAAIVLLLVRGGRRWNPAFRHALLMVALVKFAVPPTLNFPIGLFSQLRPGLTAGEAGLTVRIPPAMERTLWPDPADAPQQIKPLAPQPRRSVAAPPPRSKPVPPAVAALPGMKVLLMLLHLAGAAVILVLVSCQQTRLRRFASRAALVRDADLLSIYSSLCAGFGLRRRPELLVSDETRVPIAFGVRRRVVMLPSRLVDALKGSELAAVMAHELAHHHRRDILLRWLEIPISMTWWFNPVYWLVSRAIRSAREDCCDDMVVASGLTTGASYCETLLQAARLASGSGMRGTAFAYIDESRHLGRRFKRLMSANSTRAPKLAAGGVVLVTCLGFFLLPGIRPTARLRDPVTCPCEPSPEVRQVLDLLPRLSQDFSVPRAERMRPLRRLAERYPRDIFVQSRLQDSFRDNLYLYPEFDDAFASYRSDPNDPIFRYLEARLTGVFDPARSERMLNDILAAHPGFAWAHFDIARQSSRYGVREPQKAEEHLPAFLRSCPESLEGYALLQNVDDVDILRENSGRFRRLLESRRDASTFPYWPDLWDVEFRVAPSDDAGPVLENIRRDIALIKTIPGSFTWEWYRAFKRAGELTGDNDMFAWAEQKLRESPESPVMRDRNNDSGFSRLIRSWPPEEDLPLDRKLALVDEMLAFRTKSPDCCADSDPPFFIHVAQLYVEWNVRLERIPALVQQEQAAARYLNTSMGRAQDYVARVRQQGNLVVASAYLAQKKLDLAREVIERGISELPAGSKQILWEWNPLQTRLAELDGNPARALELKQARLSAMNEAASTNVRPSKSLGPLTAFDATDTSGRRWQLSDMKGKTTLIDIWSAELPLMYHRELQSLYDRIKNRDDVQLLTINMDLNPYLAERHLSANKYSFPVILSRTLASQLFPQVGSARFVIVDAEGRQRMASCRKREGCITVELELEVLKNWH